MTIHCHTLIIGSGISGASAGHKLREPFLILERESVPGGLSTQYRSGDWYFDYGGHYFHFKNNPHTAKFIKSFALFNSYLRNSKVYLNQRLIPFPVQFNLRYLPAETRRRILNDIRTTFNFPEDSLANQLKNRFGQGLFNEFFNPFLSKYYGYPLELLAPDMDRGSIPTDSREKIIAGASKKVVAPKGYNDFFNYPPRGLRHFWKSYVRTLGNKIRFNENVCRIDLGNNLIWTEGSCYSFQNLISTIPLNALLTLIGPQTGLPDPDSLQHTSTRILNLVLKKKRKRFHWVYLPQKRFSFYRAGYYPGTAETRMYLEQSGRFFGNASAEILKQEAAICLKELGCISDDAEILHLSERIIPVSYVLFDKKWKKTVPETISFLRARNIYSIGRYGTWNYSSMAEDARNAFETARRINRKSRAPGGT